LNKTLLFYVTRVQSVTNSGYSTLAYPNLNKPLLSMIRDSIDNTATYYH